MANDVIYRVFLSDIAMKEWYRLPCVFIPHSILKQYDIGFEVCDGIPYDLFPDNRFLHSFGWVLQNLDTGELFTDILDLCVDIKKTRGSV